MKVSISKPTNFKDAFHSHFKAEPPAIIALRQCSTTERPIDILGIADTAGKKQVNLSFVFNVLLVFSKHGYPCISREGCGTMCSHHSMVQLMGFNQGYSRTAFG
ncbi:hypothetical protein F4801DRAFT_528885 [Xylaria longipes]|nr:hypothetical protein F4801DRAFT_528885 [Xylaria longipes]